MKKTIITTHIDTGGHGYYSVSKKDIAMLGIADKISGYSGHTLNRVYLEEDCDATLLYDACKAQGIEVKTKPGYNLKFKVTHNYNPSLFNWEPKINQTILSGDRYYTIIGIGFKSIIVRNANETKFSIPLSNPFKYIDSVIN